MSFIIQNISLAVFDVNFRSLPPLISESNVFKIGTVTYQWNQLFAVLATIPVLLLLSWLVRSTKQGKGMRAVSQTPMPPAIMGVNVNRTISSSRSRSPGPRRSGRPALPDRCSTSAMTPASSSG